MTLRSRSSILAPLAYAALFVTSLVCVLHVRLAIVDDGFIAHRYAANLVHGDGLVFTRGQRVEGISDLGWTLLMTIPQLLHWRPELFAIGLGFLSAAAAILIAYRTAVSQLAVSPLVAFAVMLTASINADYWLMASNGIESGLYALVLTATFSLILQTRLLLAGTLLGLATTLRPESVVLAPLALAFIAALAYWDTRGLTGPIRAIRSHSRLLVPWAIIFLAVLAWRLTYYGQWVPNTIPAKLHPLTTGDLISGAKYLVKFSGAIFPWAILSSFALFRRKPVLPLLGFCWLAYQIAVVMLNGGDWMPGYRLVNVYLPILACLSAFALDSLLAATATLRIPFLAALLILCCMVQANNRVWTLHGGFLAHHATLREMVPPTYEPYFIDLSKALKPALKPDDILAPEVLGFFSYELLANPMHDWLGLVDSYIAHHGTVYYPRFGKADPAYSVDVVAPTLFAFASGPKELAVFQSHTNGRFSQKYDCWQVTGQPVLLAIRRDRAQAILSALRKASLPLEAVTPVTILPSPTN